MQKNIIDMTTMICYRILVDEQYRLTSDDNREKLHAMELFKDTHLVKLELLSNATAIDSALNYIRNKQQKNACHQIQQVITATMIAIVD